MNKNPLFICGGILVALLVLNLYFSYTVNHNQIAYQRHLLIEQNESGANAFESTIHTFENEINALLYSQVLRNLDITIEDPNQEGLRRLELMLLHYRDLVKGISIYDRNRNVLNLSFNKREKLLIDPYITQRQNPLSAHIQIIREEDNFTYVFPVFEDSLLDANLVISIDIQNFMQHLLLPYPHDRNAWQWLTDDKGHILFSNGLQQMDEKAAGLFSAWIAEERTGFIQHAVVEEENHLQAYTAFVPVSVMDTKFGVGFSIRKAFIASLLSRKLIQSAAVTAVLIVLLLGALTYFFRMESKGRIDLTRRLQSMQAIWDTLPVGMMVMDSEKRTKMINTTACDMLMLEKEGNLIGKVLSDRFLFSGDYFDESDSETAFDTHQFVIFQREGEEVAIYRKETPIVLDDEPYLLSAFMDVTAIEKARKYEAAANTAKSEFLAKMSHEIRTPMNGIIGMAEALDAENLSADQKEYIQIVKRSADLLLNLIDDILDFSKIEAGKMQLEEIPFRLRDEVKMAADLFRPIISEKKLELQIHIIPQVPENLIGDPFRLRQVLTNLISNAVKFTHEGQICISVSLEEEYDNNLTLLFVVEDTGVGIPRSRIETIFNSFTQAEESTSRKYGGSGLGTTIAKQLVTLMHGEIWVESPSTISTDPRYPGSKFSFTIEVYSNEKLHKTINTDKFSKPAEIRTLLVTQKEQVLQRLPRLLDHTGLKYEEIDYDNTQFGVFKNRLLQGENNYHLLILADYSNLNGMQIAKRLKEEKLTDYLVVIMISTNHKPDSYIQSKRFGIDHYLIEPVELTDFQHSLKVSFPNIEIPDVTSDRLINKSLAVLVAEDNEINIRVAETLFSNLGYTIEIARSGEEAIEKVQSRPFDIVFMDLVMPGKDGFQTTVEIRGRGHQMPVVAMTATASHKSKSRAISAGMNDYIVKPIRAEAIRNVLLKWFS